MAVVSSARVHSRKYFSATEIGDSVAVIEALDIRPVLLSCGRLHAVQRRKLNLTLEHLRKYLVGAGLLTTNKVAVGQSDANGRRLHPGNVS